MLPDRPELRGAPHAEGEETVEVAPSVPSLMCCKAEGTPVVFLEANTVASAFCF